MGSICACTRNTSVDHNNQAAKEHETTSKLDGKIIEFLKKSKIERDQNFSNEDLLKKMNFDRIILKFDMVRDSFLQVLPIFNLLKTKDNCVYYQEFEIFLKAIGVELVEQDLKDLFLESDIHQNNKLNLKEFIVSLSIQALMGYFITSQTLSGETESNQILLEINGEKHKPLFDLSKFQKGMNVITDAYLMFDEDASGTIQWDELMNILGSGSTSLKGNSNPRGTKRIGSSSEVLKVERWRELDWDNDGSITFQEFIFAFQGWIDIDDQE